MLRRFFVAAATAAACAIAVTAAAAAPPRVTTQVYDSFQAPGGYTLTNYAAKWSNIYGLGDMAATCADGSPAHGDTRSFADGSFFIADAPFTCGADFSVFDHLKYIAISNQAFPMPEQGSLTFSSEITAATPGTQAGRVVHGTYGSPGSYPAGAPYSATVLQGQQAGAVMNMVDFATGQLFDWFVAGDTAFTLIERLPSSVTGNTTDTSSPAWVGPGKMYTQIIDEVKIKPGQTHTVAITYTRGAGNGKGDSRVEYFLDGKSISKVDQVGIPLDQRPGKARYTGIYPSFGQGEDLRSKIQAFAIGHGTFSLIDAFPFQWGWSFNPAPTCDPLYPLVCDASVSIPLSQRLFGQGAVAHFDDFTVTTDTK